MRWVSLPLLWVGASLMAADGPKPAPAPATTPARPPASTIAPEFRLAPQPVYGPLRTVTPAHRLALLEVRQSLPETDPQVARFSQLLGQLTARYVEDANRIAEITTSVCQEIRATKQVAVPSEILEGALRWNRPAGSRPDVPRKFSDYGRKYLALRVKEGKDHKSALAALTPPPPPPGPKPR